MAWSNTVVICTFRPTREDGSVVSSYYKPPSGDIGCLFLLSSGNSPLWSYSRVAVSLQQMSLRRLNPSTEYLQELLAHNNQWLGKSTRVKWGIKSTANIAECRVPLPIAEALECIHIRFMGTSSVSLPIVSRSTCNGSKLIGRRAWDDQKFAKINASGTCI